jgi:GMP synthase (glutamine-hydrolysing)
MSKEAGGAMEARLKTKLQIMAAVRLCSVHAIPIMIVRRGDEDAGAILVKVNRRELGFTVLAQTRTGFGDLAWMRATGEVPVDEATADAYIARQVQRDPDLWVVEIEDRDARPIFAGRIL